MFSGAQPGEVATKRLVLRGFAVTLDSPLAFRVIQSGRGGTKPKELCRTLHEDRFFARDPRQRAGPCESLPRPNAIARSRAANAYAARPPNPKSAIALLCANCARRLFVPTLDLIVLRRIECRRCPYVRYCNRSGGV